MKAELIEVIMVSKEIKKKKHIDLFTKDGDLLLHFVQESGTDNWIGGLGLMDMLKTEFKDKVRK